MGAVSVFLGEPGTMPTPRISGQGPYRSLVIDFGGVSVFIDGHNSRCVERAREIAAALTTGADQLEAAVAAAEQVGA